MAAEGVIITFIFTGERGEVIPRNATHLIFHESVTVIPARAFSRHPNIVEVYCHAGVKRIETAAFIGCPRLRRVIIPGVEVLESWAFNDCRAVTYIECPNLEKMGVCVFGCCESLSSIDLPSIKVVENEAFGNCVAIKYVKFGKNLESIRWGAFYNCKALKGVKFGKNLETIQWGAFRNCTSLERITIPLKTGGLIASDSTFQGCVNLKCVDLVEGAVLQCTIVALLLEEWRNDLNKEIISINQILLNAAPGGRPGRVTDCGEKTQVIRKWIKRLLRKIVDYKAQHCRLLDEAASVLQLVLPSDIVINNVLPFIELPSHRFEGEGR